MNGLDRAFIESKMTPDYPGVISKQPSPILNSNPTVIMIAKVKHH